MFSASACNGSNNGSGAWQRKQYGAGSGEREESDDPLYDAVKLGLDNAGNTVLGRNSSSDGQYEYGKPGWYRDTGMGRSERLFMTQTGDTTEYTLSVKGTFTGFQFLDFDNPGNNKNPGYDSKLSQYTEDTPTDVYYIQKDGAWAYYLDADGTTAVPDLPKTETTFLLVGNIPGMAWDPSAKPNFVKSIENENVYSITLNAVPAGKYQYKILEDAATEGWNKPWAQNSDNLSLNLNAPADVTLSLDKTDKTKETKVNIAYIKDLVVEVPAQIQKGVTMELPVTGTYYGDDGNVQNGVSVTYTAKTEGITLMVTKF